MAPTLIPLPPTTDFSDHYGINARNWWGHHPGIYQLFIGDQSYVGKARNLSQRVNTAHQWAEQATRVRLLAVFAKGVPERELRNAEAFWIQLLRPELNLRPVPFIR